MAVSIFHRISGGGLTVVGLAVLTWWLLSPCDRKRRLCDFAAMRRTWVGLIVLIGLTWAFFQHLLSGIRHLVMDTGADFELGPTRRARSLTFVGAILLTAAVWFYFLGAVNEPR